MRVKIARALRWTPLAQRLRSHWAEAEFRQSVLLRIMEYGTPAYWRQVDKYDDIADAVCVLSR
jgi:hypothetical protein